MRLHLSLAVTAVLDTHHWMLQSNNLRVNVAVAEFFERSLLRRQP